MICVCDVGNSKIAFGFYENAKKIADFSISCQTRRSKDEYALLLSLFCDKKGIDAALCEGSVLSSVSPALTPVIVQAMKEITGKSPLIVGHGIKTGLDIRTERHAELGSDIVANAVGARAITKGAYAVVDLGSAITLTVVSASNELMGVAIFPGVGISLKAMAASCAGLPEVSLDKPRAILGKNTENSVIGGSVYGYAAMIDGLLARIKEDYQLEDLSVVACGGSAEKIIPYCREEISVKPDLTLNGLARIYELNRDKSAKK